MQVTVSWDVETMPLSITENKQNTNPSRQNLGSLKRLYFASQSAALIWPDDSVTAS